MSLLPHSFAVSFSCCSCRTAGFSTRAAAARSPRSCAEPDTLVLRMATSLHGKLVEEVGGESDVSLRSAGRREVAWDKIKELHAGENFAVLNTQTKNRGKKATEKLPGRQHRRDQRRGHRP